MSSRNNRLAEKGSAELSGYDRDPQHRDAIYGRCLWSRRILALLLTTGLFGAPDGAWGFGMVFIYDIMLGKAHL